MSHTRLLIVDSGIGGLSVMKAIYRIMPELDLIYAADYAAFPYGSWQQIKLRDHLIDQISHWIDQHRPDGVILACNTASTLVLKELRALHSLPFVGTVPAIKPAAQLTQTGMISVLATPATIDRDYTHNLLEEFASGLDVALVASERLAGLIEQWFMEGSDSALISAITEELMSCFFVNLNHNPSTRTDCVVLACTHYPLLKPLFVKLAPWPVHWVDPSRAISRRVKQLFGSKTFEPNAGSIQFITTGPNKSLEFNTIWGSIFQFDGRYSV